MRQSGLLRPFALTALVLAIDQAAKALVVALVAKGGIGYSGLGDLVWIIHVRNPAAAFSLGQGLAAGLRRPLFIALAVLVLAFLLAAYFGRQGWSRLERYALCGIMGGGLGNLVDRLLRPEGVVDFISLRCFGLFGFQRWPTFNLADASEVVSALILALALILEDTRKTT